MYIIFFLILVLFLLRIYSFKRINILLHDLPETSYNIPKIIFQTYHDTSRIPDEIINNTKYYSPGYSIEILDDTDGLQFLQQYYSQPVIDKFNTLSGAHKADLLRYCLLYIYGGVYFDIKTLLIRDISDFIDTENHFKHTFYSVLSINNNTIYQGFIATSPRNPIILDCIKRVLDTSLSQIKSDYLIFTKQIYKVINKYKNCQDITLFTEKCTSDTDKVLDRYGLYCKVVDSNDDDLFDTRDPNYPY